MDNFDRSFVQLLKTWRIPGASITMVQNGKITFSRGYGWADLEKREKVEPTSLFRIASISKTFTAVAALKLIEEGKIRYDDKAFEVLNDLQPFPQRNFNPRVYKITVRNLLQMSSGFLPSGKHYVDPMFGPWSREMANLLGDQNLPASCKDTVRTVMSLPLKGRPGTYYAYSNVDYCTLGLLIDKAVGADYNYLGYQNYVNQHILNPIGITDMRIGNTTLEGRQPNEVRYYRYDNRYDPSEPANMRYFPYSHYQMLHKNFANGGWIASSQDLALFAHALFSGKILKPQTLSTMLSRPGYRTRNNNRYYAMGWKVKYSNNNRLLVATGSFTGTNALMIRKPDGTIVSIVFNSRPPVYNLFRDFRPRLNRLFYASNSYHRFHEPISLENIV